LTAAPRTSLQTREDADSGGDHLLQILQQSYKRVATVLVAGGCIAAALLEITLSRYTANKSGHGHVRCPKSATKKPKQINKKLEVLFKLVKHLLRDFQSRNQAASG